MDNISVKAHTSFIGQTGYNAHARDFFTALSKIVKLRIRNFTVGKTWNGLGEKIDGKFDPHKNEEYLSEYQRNLIGIQTLYCDPNAVGRYGSNLIDYEVYDGYNIFDDNDKIIDIILNTTNHQYFFNLDKYNGFKIAYNVWESTRYNDDFFDILKKYDQFWCPSKWQRDCIVEQGYPEDKVFIVPEAIDEKIFHPAYFNPNIDNYTDNRFKFILFGRWEFRKSTTEIIQTFLKTFDANDPVDLIISVDNTFSDDNLKSTEERLSYYNLNDNRIKVIHFPKREDYINYLKNGHVYLSCSRSEGWGLPLCEAMACGTPSIYSNCSGQLEFAEGKGHPVKIEKEIPFDAGNYYEPDFNDLSLVMKDVYINYWKYKEKALKDSDDIRNKFTWENAANKAYEILRDIK
jgi:glycosyltransferase involved in cell wall biosynthesis